MNVRVVAALLLAGALALHFGYVEPRQREAALAQQTFARARSERARLLARLAELTRAEGVRLRVARMDQPGGTGPADAAARLRQSALGALEGMHVSRVQLTVTPARSPLAAKLSLKAEGAFPEVVRLSSRLVRPGAGVVLEHVALDPASDGTVSFVALGVSLEARP